MKGIDAKLVVIDPSNLIPDKENQYEFKIFIQDNKYFNNTLKLNAVLGKDSIIMNKCSFQVKIPKIENKSRNYKKEHKETDDWKETMSLIFLNRNPKK